MLQNLLGFDSDYIIIGLAVLLLVIIVLYIVNLVQLSKLKKRYKIFMTGKTAKSLEDTLLKRLNQVDSLIASNSANEQRIEEISKSLKNTYQKAGLVKYDAFHEMGGKLSFSLAMLNEGNNGFIMNAVHSREGCYTYIKEVVDGNAILTLSEEEQEALDMAKENK